MSIKGSVPAVARVAVFRPIEKLFDYSIPTELGESVRPGTRVWAPWGSRAVEGVVVEIDPAGALDKRRALDQVIDAPPISDQLLALARWMAEYYMAPLGEVLRLLLPAGGRARARRTVELTEEGRKVAAGLSAALESVALGELLREERELLSRLGKRARTLELLEKDLPGSAAVAERLRDRGLLAIEEMVRTRRSRGRDSFVDRGEVPEHPPTLTSFQARAMVTIDAALAEGRYAPFVLHGVTGSGKTEVYLRAIAGALERGRSALVLVPEISLTPQLAARFSARFGSQVAVLHSGLSDAARAEAWRRIERQEVSIALGARSAVFAPLERLGIVVVDEEHDSSFKQQEGVRYHGRDVALKRGRAAEAVVLLGSATPSLETFFATKEGRLGLIELPERATAKPLPKVEVIDLRQHRPLAGTLLSERLMRALSTTLSAGDQAILFLNRRGFSTFILCKSCGQAARCRDCSVTLTYHRGSARLVCHYCGYSAPPPLACGQCGARSIERLGYGTEQVEAWIAAHFPSARVARLDRDTADSGGLERVLDGVRARTVDILVGTQMITKGHDFPGVTLVGVVLADHGMGLPDFRAGERTFQLLEQVAGRAGRGERAGQVIVQTYNPLHPAVTCAREHAYHRFAEEELRVRHELGYPPSSRMACVHFDGADPQAVRRAAEEAGRLARTAAKRAPAELGAVILGPAEAPLGRLKGRTRWQLFVRAKTVRALRILVKEAATAAADKVRISIDVDPSSML